jgi:tetratricopeptide (TPR) repeat protein
MTSPSFPRLPSRTQPARIHRWGVAALVAVTCAASAWAQSKPAATSAPAPWSAKDTAGQAVAVPAAERTTVLVFLRPSQQQSARTIEELRAAVKDKPVQVVGIVSGDEAAQGAAALAKPESKWNWPVVIDPEYAASGQFGVHVWPTTVVITRTGAQAAHMAGLPASFAGDLEAYLAFADGKIDQAGLDKRLAGQEIVADSAEQKASRHIQVAQRLAEKGLKDQAKAELAKAAEYKPADPAAQAALARMFLTVGEPKSADALLARIKDEAVAPAELNMLRGWSAVQQEQWDEARAKLTEAVKLNPQPAEACYLLGLVYEHKGDSAKATAAYRKAFEHTPLGRVLAPSPGP